jgi:hypothetical protein
MRITTVRVTGGRLDVEAADFPEGKLVKVVLLEDEPVHLTAEEREWLHEAQADARRRSECSDALTFLDELED